METPDIPPCTLVLDADDVKPRTMPFAGGQVAVFSRRCPGKESSNEDVAALLAAGDETGLLAVADGCGGMASGEVAARTAVESLQSVLDSASDSPSPLRTIVLDAFEKANRQVLEIGGGAATTMAVVEVDGPVLRTYHVGDSSIMLLGNRGKIRLLTTSHSPVGYALEAGILDEHEAIHHEDRHLVSNVIGTEDFHIEIGSRRKMHVRDTIVIGSDGLFDNLLLTEIVEIVRKGPLPQAARHLAQLASDRMDHPIDGHPSKPDDLTFILFRPGPRRDGARRQRPSQAPVGES